MIVRWSPCMYLIGSVSDALGVKYFEIQISSIVLEPGGQVGGESLQCRLETALVVLIPSCPKKVLVFPVGILVDIYSYHYARS